jgi:hypothetical protein
VFAQIWRQGDKLHSTPAHNVTWNFCGRLDIGYQELVWHCSILVCIHIRKMKWSTSSNRLVSWSPKTISVCPDDLVFTWLKPKTLDVAVLDQQYQVQINKNQWFDWSTWLYWLYWW